MFDTGGLGVDLERQLNKWFGARGDFYTGPRPRDRQPVRHRGVSLTQIRRNQTHFMNWVWDVSKAVQLGFEVDYPKTDYSQFAPNAFLDSDAVIIASRLLWRF